MQRLHDYFINSESNNPLKNRGFLSVKRNALCVNEVLIDVLKIKISSEKLRNLSRESTVVEVDTGAIDVLWAVSC
jgi:hypothetical protein